MGPLHLVLVSACLLTVSGYAEESEPKELIMLEFETLNYDADGGRIVKRGAEAAYSPGPPQQYLVNPAVEAQQVPPEYVSLLQQLSAQQGHQPQDIQQLYISRTPQQGYSELPYQTGPQQVPRRRPLTPEQQQQKILQESTLNKHIREQQQRALQQALYRSGYLQYPNQQLVYQPQYQYVNPQPLYQQPVPQAVPQPIPQPVYQPQVVYQPQATTIPQPHPAEVPAYITQRLVQQYASQPQPQPNNPPHFYQQARSVPKKVAYSQIEYKGSEDSNAPTLAALQQRLQIQQAQEAKIQNLINTESQFNRALYADSGQPAPLPGPLQQTPRQPQHPEQYLIETTKPIQNSEQIIRISKPSPQQQFYSSPLQQYDEHYLATVYQQQNNVEYTTATTKPPLHPSRSSIFVHKSGVSEIKRPTPTSSLENVGSNDTPLYQVGTPQGQRALTHTELTALAQAGFHISPEDFEDVASESFVTATPKTTQLYRTSDKRQSKYETEDKLKYSKRVPKPVPLTEDERKSLAEQGIRNLYKVESSESQGVPVTYVLALENTVRPTLPKKTVT